MSEEIGIIYISQPCELIGTNRYKIGTCNKSTIDNCQNNLKKDSRILFIIECINPHVIKSIVKKEFNKKFELIAGAHYFKGDEIEIKKSFRDIVFNYIDELNDL